MPRSFSTRQFGMRSGLGQGEDPPAEVQRKKDFFIYESQTLQLAPGANATDTINIEADSNFILQKLSHYSLGGAPTFPDLTDFTAANTAPFGLPKQYAINPAVLVQLIDTGSGRQLMQNPVPISSFFGTGELPFILPNPRLFMRNSTIQVQYTSFDTVNTYDIRLAFIGFKVYSVN